MRLDHENLDIYNLAIEFNAWPFGIYKKLTGNNRFARDQLLRASQSIALNIAEGCGEIPAGERGRYFQIASGSARECAALLDILARCSIFEEEKLKEGKDYLSRIVAMLTRMLEGLRLVREESVQYVFTPEISTQRE